VSDRGHTDPAQAYVDRLAGYDRRLTSLERSHVHEPFAPTGAVVAWPGVNAPALWVICDGRALSRTAYPDLWNALSTTWGAGDGSTTFNIPDLRSQTIVGQGQYAGMTLRGVGTHGGAETVALSAAQNGAHGHGVNIASAIESAMHQHTTPSLNSLGQSADHNHSTPALTTGGDSGHTHQNPYSTAVGPGGNSGAGPFSGYSGSTGPSSGHTHGVPAATSGLTSGGHIHGVPAGTTSTDSGDHTHAVTGNTDGGGSTGAAHPNMPPFAVCIWIIKVLPSTAATPGGPP
jgi:microcystin-dependent protein